MRRRDFDAQFGPTTLQQSIDAWRLQGKDLCREMDEVIDYWKRKGSWRCGEYRDEIGAAAPFIVAWVKNENPPLDVWGPEARRTSAYVSLYGAGSNTFRLASGLCEALLLTSFSSPTQALQLPFPSFVLQLPRSIQSVKLPSSLGNPWPMTECIVGHCDVGLCLYAVGYDPATGEPRTANRFKLPIPSEDRVVEEEEWMELIQAELPVKCETAYIRDVIRITLNAILYINSANADLRCAASGHDRKAMIPSDEEPSSSPPGRHRTYEVGHSVMIPRSPDDRGEGGDSSWHYHHRFWVRGHWRLQPVGVGRGDRRLLWVRPHLKGPELATVLKRPYTVVGKG